jgi:hypothetical protein
MDGEDGNITNLQSLVKSEEPVHHVFKTYEGRVIQAGFGKGKGVNAGAIQSYEFDFSITDQAIADSLMRCGGKTVELRYKEYLGTLPWRGKQKYIVDGIVSVRE